MATQITLTKSEENNMIFEPDFYGYEVNGKFFTIGWVPVTSRVAKIIGKRDKYYVLHTTQKDYRVYKVTNDLQSAEFTYNNAMNFAMFEDAFKQLKVKKSSGKVQNKSVNKKSNKKHTTDPILQMIYSVDTKPQDSDTEEVLAAKRNLATVRPRDMKVIIIPEKEPFY